MMEEEFTVSRLSALIKRSLETNFGRIKLTAEVSALKIHSSGHAYFSLKDESAIIDAICWRSTLQRAKHQLENGLKITCFGKVSSYQMQSKYQFVVEKFEPAGIGNLLKLLEERKQKLAKEGLFDPNLIWARLCRPCYPLCRPLPSRFFYCRAMPSPARFLLPIFDCCNYYDIIM